MASLIQFRPKFDPKWNSTWIFRCNHFVWKALSSTYLQFGYRYFGQCVRAND